MTDLSPALLADLEFAVSRYGLTIADVPRDHEGLTITDRLARLVDHGESYCHSGYRRTDLRKDSACVWELFPQNPATLREQTEMVDEAGDLLHQEQDANLPDGVPSLVRASELARSEHVDALRGLLAFIDGGGPAPTVGTGWADTTLFDTASDVVPALRQAEETASLREQLVLELTTGIVPPASAGVVRRALDSETEGLRNADITLAGHRVVAARLRDSAELALEALLPRFEVAERIRQLRDDLDAIDEVLHWPGLWRTAPHRDAAETRVSA